MGKGKKLAAAGLLVLGVKAAALCGTGAVVSSWLDEVFSSGRIRLPRLIASMVVFDREATRLKLKSPDGQSEASASQEAKEKSGIKAAQSADKCGVPSVRENHSETPMTAEAEVIPVTQLEQVRSLIGDVLTEVVTENNETLKKDISKAVTTDVMREMDFLFQAKERQEEEHFRKLDCLIRQQQASRRETVKGSPIGRLKKMFT